jgi:hypothetical protein
MSNVQQGMSKFQGGICAARGGGREKGSGLLSQDDGEGERGAWQDDFGQDD